MEHFINRNPKVHWLPLIWLFQVRNEVSPVELPVLMTFTSPTQVTMSPGVQLPVRLLLSSISTVLRRSPANVLPSGLRSYMSEGQRSAAHC